MITLREFIGMQKGGEDSDTILIHDRNDKLLGSYARIDYLKDTTYGDKNVISFEIDDYWGTVEVCLDIEKSEIIK